VFEVGDNGDDGGGGGGSGGVIVDGVALLFGEGGGVGRQLWILRDRRT